MPSANSDEFCSNQYDDKYNFIFNFCPQSVACEGSKFNNITTNSTAIYAEALAMQVGQGCTYKVNTTCGYPQMNVSFVNTVPSDYDILYAVGEWNYQEDFNATLFKDNWFSDDQITNVPGDQVNSGNFTVSMGVD